MAEPLPPTGPASSESDTGNNGSQSSDNKPPRGCLATLLRLALGLTALYALVALLQYGWQWGHAHWVGDPAVTSLYPFQSGYIWPAERYLTLDGDGCFVRLIVGAIVPVVPLIFLSLLALPLNAVSKRLAEGVARGLLIAFGVITIVLNPISAFFVPRGLVLVDISSKRIEIREHLQLLYFYQLPIVTASTTLSFEELSELRYRLGEEGFRGGQYEYVSLEATTAAGRYQLGTARTRGGEFDIVSGFNTATAAKDPRKQIGVSARDTLAHWTGARAAEE